MGPVDPGGLMIDELYTGVILPGERWGSCLKSGPGVVSRKWRNWQTRQVEGLVGVKSRGGSNPLLRNPVMQRLQLLAATSFFALFAGTPISLVIFSCDSGDCEVRRGPTAGEIASRNDVDENCFIPCDLVLC